MQEGRRQVVIKLPIPQGLGRPEERDGRFLPTDRDLQTDSCRVSGSRELMGKRCLSSSWSSSSWTGR
jgi:hypothetical protein